MKVLITWIGPYLDKGEAAMLLSMKDALQQQIPNISITASASSFSPQNIDVVKYGEHCIKLLPGLFSSLNLAFPKLEFLKFKVAKAALAFPLFFYIIIINALWLGLYKRLGFDAGFLFRDNNNKRDTVKEYLNADWIIFCGGEYIINSGITVFIALYEIIFSKSLDKPVMLYAQSFGPFNQKYARPLIKLILNKVDVITTREEISKEYLITLGVTAPIFVTADAAFMLNSIPREEAISLLEQETKISRDNLIIGMTTIYKDYPSQNVEAYDPVENYFVSMAESIDYVINKLNAFVIIYPHNKTTNKKRNDGLASQEILKMVKNKNRVVILTGDYTPEQLKGMYGCMDLFIGTRYHSCIFALSMNVPTIAIGYRHKAQGIMKMLEMEKYVCDINMITTHELTSKIDTTWAEREEITKKLEKNIKITQDKCMDNARLAVEYLGLQKR